MVSSGRPELVQVWVGAQSRVGPWLRREEAQGFPLTSWPAQGETGPAGLLPAGGKRKCSPLLPLLTICPQWPPGLHIHTGVFTHSVKSSRGALFPGRDPWGPGLALVSTPERASQPTQPSLCRP